MARTRAEIEQVIYDKKAELESTTHPQLQGLTSTSGTAVWRAIIICLAYGQWTLETLWDRFKVEITELLARNVYGTLAWYRNMVLQFQWDASASYYMTLNEFFEAEYNEVVEDDRIVKFAACTESTVGNIPVVTIKCAAADGSGNPQQLTTAQLDALNAYINRKKPAGVRTNTISLPADEVLPTVAVKFDPLSEPDELRERIKEAMTDYLYGLPFNGEFFLETLRDVIQLVEGVIDVDITSCTITSGGGATVKDLLLERSLVLAAGYGVWDDDWDANNDNYLTLTPKE